VRDTSEPPKERFVEQTAVLAGERHTLGDTLVNDVTLTWASRQTLASRERKSPPLMVS